MFQGCYEVRSKSCDESAIIHCACRADSGVTAACGVNDGVRECAKSVQEGCCMIPEITARH